MKTSIGFDPFRPREGAALAIYDAFQAEAAKRKTRPGLTWIETERDAVHAAAAEQARHHGWPAPSLQLIERAEISARGHCDYGSKWAHYIVDAMRREAAQRDQVAA